MFYVHVRMYYRTVHGACAVMANGDRRNHPHFHNMKRTVVATYMHTPVATKIATLASS